MIDLLPSGCERHCASVRLFHATMMSYEKSHPMRASPNMLHWDHTLCCAQVRYDKRLGNYLSSVASASSSGKTRHTRFLVYEAAKDLALLDFPRWRESEREMKRASERASERNLSRFPLI